MPKPPCCEARPGMQAPSVQYRRPGAACPAAADCLGSLTPASQGGTDKGGLTMVSHVARRGDESFCQRIHYALQNQELSTLINGNLNLDTLRPPILSKFITRCTKKITHFENCASSSYLKSLRVAKPANLDFDTLKLSTLRKFITRCPATESLCSALPRMGRREARRAARWEAVRTGRARGVGGRQCGEGTQRFVVCLLAAGPRGNDIPRGQIFSGRAGGIHGRGRRLRLATACLIECPLLTKTAREIGP